MPDVHLTDPLGRTIVLYDRTWYGHIVKAHPEMAAARPLIEQTVRSPDQIRHSQSDPNCRIYYGPGPRPGIIIMVVADIVLGIVKTAHLAKQVSGGSQEWSK
jgi:hypothetical protein